MIYFLVIVCIDQVPTDVYEYCRLCRHPDPHGQNEWCNEEWKGTIDGHDGTNIINVNGCIYSYDIEGKRKDRCKGSCNNCGKDFAMIATVAVEILVLYDFPN